MLRTTLKKNDSSESLEGEETSTCAEFRGELISKLWAPFRFWKGEYVNSSACMVGVAGAGALSDLGMSGSLPLSFLSCSGVTTISAEAGRGGKICRIHKRSMKRNYANILDIT